jgi:transposase
MPSTSNLIRNRGVLAVSAFIEIRRRGATKCVDTAISCVISRGVSEERSAPATAASANDATREDLAELLGSSPALLAALRAERAAFDAERTTFAQRIAELEKERDNLRASHERLRQELELFKRRLFIAKAERADTKQLEIEFAQKLRELDALADTLGMAKEDDDHQDGDANDADAKASDGKPRGKRKNNGGTGRRNLRDLPLEEERIEISDPHLEKLVEAGKVVRHGFDETPKLAHKRGGKRRVIIARVRYKTVDAQGNTDVITTAMPAEMLRGALAAPSLVAHVIMENIGKGLPLFRIEDSFAREGLPIDRGTLCRWKKRVGDGLAAVVKAMQLHAFATAFCIATDATGICVQPIYSREKGRQPCKKGHFLVQIADKDHIFFEYLERETSAKVSAAFFGFSGYVQADAKNVFDVLFCDAEAVSIRKDDIEPDGCTRTEVGCWYHCRKRYWEAAVAKSAIGREGLARIGRIFELDASWRKKPPSERKRLRDLHLRPHIVSFFAWVDEQRPLFKDQRGYVRTALEYTHNQRAALLRFLDDGRLLMENNRSERAIKAVVLGRRAWLFCGSDDHAKGTATLFSIVASARLHGLEPEEYLRCLIRLVPLWPEDRLLELAPLFWARTRARLDPLALARELGPVAIPLEPLDTSVATEQEAAG